MIGKVVGLGTIFQGDKSKNKGKPYHGQTIYVSYNKKEVEGCATYEFYNDMLGVSNPQVIKIGDQLFLDFDNNGRLIDMEVVNPQK